VAIHAGLRKPPAFTRASTACVFVAAIADFLS
jgi:hypothetical protein